MHESQGRRMLCNFLRMNGDDRSFEDILKFVLDILKNENLFEVG